MVSFERMSRIMDILGKKKVISTTQLESLVYCSTSTLRRDLIALERDGKILRSHGEVRLANSNNIEYTYSARAHEEQRSKEIIADIASTFITDNLSSSSTALPLLPVSFPIYPPTRICASLPMGLRRRAYSTTSKMSPSSYQVAISTLVPTPPWVTLPPSSSITFMPIWPSSPAVGLIAMLPMRPTTIRP